MNWACLSLLLFAATIPSFSQEVAAPPEDKEIAALRAPDRQAKEALAAAEDKALVNLRTWYLASLDKLAADTQAGGNLEQVLLIRKEKERIATREPVTPVQLNAMPASLRKLRTSYDGSLKKIRDDAATRRDTLNRKLLASLEALQIRLTKAGEIDRALLVKAEKEKLMAERPAQEASAVAGLPSSASPQKTSSSPKQAPQVAASERAEIEPMGGKAAALEIGKPMFSDRDYKWDERRVPEFVRGWNHVLASMKGGQATCTKAGTVYMLTHAREPNTWGDSLEDDLKAKGFSRVTTIKYGDGPGNVYAILSKRIRSGEKLSWGRFAVLIF